MTLFDAEQYDAADYTYEAIEARFDASPKRLIGDGLPENWPTMTADERVEYLKRGCKR